MSGEEDEGQVKGLFIRGRTREKGLGDKGQYKSKSRSKKDKCHDCHKPGHFR